MANSNEIKVDAKAFQTTSDEITKIIKTLEQSFNTYFTSLNSLRGGWQGDTSDRIRALSKSMNDSMSMLINNLSAYPKALYEVAGIYQKAEETISKQGQSLNFDVSSMS